MHIIKILLLILLLTPLFSTESVLKITLENDFLVLGDEFYTNGIEVSVVHRLKDPFIFDMDKNYVTTVFRHSIFTPNDLSEEHLIKGDIPYTGIFTMGKSYYSMDFFDMHSVSIDIGAIGEMTMAKLGQQAAHEIVDDEKPEGWGNQTPSEIAFNIGYENRKRLLRLHDGLESEMIFSWGAMLGNISTKAHMGLHFRFGDNLPSDFVIYPTMFTDKQIGSLIEHKGTSTYVTMGIETVYHFRAVQFDGAFLSTSHSVEYDELAYRTYIGFNSVKRNTGLSITLVAEPITWESEDSSNADVYASISILKMF